MTHHHDKPFKCPYCEYEMELSTAVEDDSVVPHPGAISICINCGEAGFYAEDLSVRKITPDEYALFDDETKSLLARIKLLCLSNIRIS